MKKTIDGKLYNTDTATKLGSYDNGLSISDFNEMSEVLYITTKGSVFLSGEGGANSKYSETVGNMRSRGKGLIALDDEGVIEWCERTDNSEILIDHFPHLVEEA